MTDLVTFRPPWRWLWSVGLTLATLGLAAPAARATDTVSLLAKESFVGWDYGGVDGWAVAGGKLSGSDASCSLISGHSAADFEIETRITAPRNARLAWQLHAVSDGSIVEVPIEIRRSGNDQVQIFTITRTGTTIAGPDGFRTTAPESERFVLGLRILNGHVAIDDIRLTEPDGARIFNERDLAGWSDHSGGQNWRVTSQGSLLKPRNKDTTSAGYLGTKHEYGNFKLSLDYRIEKGGNSGIAIRTPQGGWPSSDGFELQILDRPDVPGKQNMAIYGNVAPVALAHRSGEWNRVVVKADGPLLTAWVNGHLVQHINTRNHPELMHRALHGWIGLQDHLDEVEFRGIRLLPINQSTDFGSWQSALPADFEGLCRLMNPERLTMPESTTPSKGIEQLLANYDSTGPVANMIEVDAQGRFQLAGRLRTDASPSDHPALPKKMLGDFRRLWQPALEYRLSFHRFGRIPHPMAYPDAHGLVLDLSPGDRAEAVAIEGRGVVQWMRLECDDQTLFNDDLWIEIERGDDPEGRVSCPARLWFAPIAHGTDHHNFIATRSDGYVSRLPIPFSSGVKIFLRNADRQPVQHVGISAGYRRDAFESPGRLRLNAHVVEPTGRRSTIDFAGRGRLVGVVVDGAADNDVICKSLSVDGHEVPAWNRLTLSQFMGPRVANRQSQHRLLSGFDRDLAWRYLFLSPIEFNESLTWRLSEGRRFRTWLLSYNNID